MIRKQHIVLSFCLCGLLFAIPAQANDLEAMLKKAREGASAIRNTDGKIKNAKYEGFDSLFWNLSHTVVKEEMTEVSGLMKTKDSRGRRVVGRGGPRLMDEPGEVFSVATLATSRRTDRTPHFIFGATQFGPVIFEHCAGTGAVYPIEGLSPQGHELANQVGKRFKFVLRPGSSKKVYGSLPVEYRVEQPIKITNSGHYRELANQFSAFREKGAAQSIAGRFNRFVDRMDRMRKALDPRQRASNGKEN